MNRRLLIGVLGLQGDIEENIDVIKLTLEEMKLDGKAISVRYPEEISQIDGLIIPGGESTVMGTLLRLKYTSLKIIQKRLSEGLPALGSCAGMILLARKAYDKVVGEREQQMLSALDIVVERNSFGRQNNSFESNLSLDDIGESFRGVFIRAPSVTEAGSKVKILGKFDDKIVAVKQENIIGTSFHPELSGDIRFHVNFLKSVIKWKSTRCD